MDLALASRLIEAQFPELSPVRAVYLGEGCDSTALEVNGAWVFRFPGADDVELQLGIEARILPILEAHLPVAIPRLRFHGERSAEFPRRFHGYAKLPGTSAIRLDPSVARPDGLVEPLAHFLSALHACPARDAARAGLPEQRLSDVMDEKQSDALDDFDAAIEAAAPAAAPDAPFDEWRSFLAARPAPARPAPLVVVHNDLAAEHVLVDPASEAITGVIDWSEVALGDAAVDVAGVFHWGGELFARAVLAASGAPPDERSLAVARHLAACRGAMDVAFGVQMGRPEYVTAGLRALQLCASG
jgi:aminoglycoside phosphotransferase (APT) family kinase protein